MPQVCCYYWEDSATPANNAWRLGDKVGGNGVIGLHPNNKSLWPPFDGWSIPPTNEADGTIMCDIIPDDADEIPTPSVTTLFNVLPPPQQITQATGAEVIVDTLD